MKVMVTEGTILKRDGGPRMHNGLRIFAAFATLLGLAFSAAGAAAQVNDDTAETSCVTADLGGQQLQVGIADRTTAVPVALPAGTISIPSARATDSYPTRVNVTQLSEKYEVEFISAGGQVIATSIPTEDVPDMVEFGEWIGSLGSVELSEPAVAIRAHHLPNLPFDGSPESLKANEITFCFEVETSGPTVDPVCGDEGITTNPDGTPCNPVCGDEGITTNPDGTPCNPVCGDEGITTNPDGTPCNPVCGDEGITTNPDGTPCNPVTTTDGETTSPTIPGPTTTQDEETAGPTTTQDEETAGPTTTQDEETAGPTTTQGEETAGPTTDTTAETPATTTGGNVSSPEDNDLPMTGSNSALLLVLGGVMLLAGGALVITDRRIG